MQDANGGLGGVTVLGGMGLWMGTELTGEQGLGVGKWRRCEDDNDMDRVAEIKALRVPFLLHVLPFHLIGSLGSFCFCFFF